MSSMVENRIEHSFDVMGKYAVMFGGYEGQKIFNEVKLFDLVAFDWISPMIHGTSPSHRYAHGSAVVAGALFIFGGMDKHQPLNDLWRYSIETSAWNRIDYSGIVSGLFRTTMIGLQGGFLIVGGCKEYQVDQHDRQDLHK